MTVNRAVHYTIRIVGGIFLAVSVWGFSSARNTYKSFRSSVENTVQTQGEWDWVSDFPNSIDHYGWAIIIGLIGYFVIGELLKKIARSDA